MIPACLSRYPAVARLYAETGGGGQLGFLWLVCPPTPAVHLALRRLERQLRDGCHVSRSLRGYFGCILEEVEADLADPQRMARFAEAEELARRARRPAPATHANALGSLARIRERLGRTG